MAGPILAKGARVGSGEAARARYPRDPVLAGDLAHSMISSELRILPDTAVFLIACCTVRASGSIAAARPDRTVNRSMATSTNNDETSTCACGGRGAP